MKNCVVLLICGSLVVYVLLSGACTTDKLPEPVILVSCDTLPATYNGLVKPIIDRSCALSGCHVNGGGAPGVFTSYSGMAAFLNESGFEKFVVDLKNDPERGMPPNWTSNPGPKDLSAYDFAILKCWIENGYLED